jgi:protein-S-isoprenylcysteine O-methyltransferase Ste14
METNVLFARLLITALAAAACLFLTLTAKIEEKENKQYFGEAYQNYIQKTKMFIPFVI